MNWLSLALAVGSTSLLGLAKRFDNPVVNSGVYRKLQPLIALGLTAGASYLAAKLPGVQLDPATVAAAPLSTLTAVALAELTALAGKRK